MKLPKIFKENNINMKDYIEMMKNKDNRVKLLERHYDVEDETGEISDKLHSIDFSFVTKNRKEFEYVKEVLEKMGERIST